MSNLELTIAADPRQIAREVARVHARLSDAFETARRVFGSSAGVTVESAMLEYGNVQPTETSHCASRAETKAHLYTALVSALAEVPKVLEMARECISSQKALIDSLKTETSVQDAAAAIELKERSRPLQIACWDLDALVNRVEPFLPAMKSTVRRYIVAALILSRRLRVENVASQLARLQQIRLSVQARRDQQESDEIPLHALLNQFRDDQSSELLPIPMIRWPEDIFAAPTLSE